MKTSRVRLEPTVLRDQRGAAIEVNAPCDVHWRGAWHRGKVMVVKRVRVVVNVIPFSHAQPYRATVLPRQLVVLGPTYEDVGKESAARAAARAESSGFLPEPDPDPES